MSFLRRSHCQTFRTAAKTIRARSVNMQKLHFPRRNLCPFAYAIGRRRDGVHRVDDGKRTHVESRAWREKKVTLFAPNCAECTKGKNGKLSQAPLTYMHVCAFCSLRRCLFRFGSAKADNDVLKDYSEVVLKEQ